MVKAFSFSVEFNSLANLKVLNVGFSCSNTSLCRSDTIESVLCGLLFPIEFSIKDKVQHWVRVFSGFDKVEVKALEKILEQKQRYRVNSWLARLQLLISLKTFTCGL